MDKKDIASRLKKIRAAYKDGSFTQDAFCQLISIPLTTYKNLEGGKAFLSLDKIDAIKNVIGVNPLWLLYGEGSMFIDDPSSNEILIPYYDDIKASAGLGAINGDVREPEYIHLPRSLMCKGCRSKTEAIKCSGDSMTPFLKDGDIMFVDRNQTELKDGDVYVVRFGEDIFVKRLFRVPGKLIAKSDNPLYPEFDLTSDSFEILGKVIYKMEEA